MNIYLHIGATKTGSSALQKFLNQNAQRLQKKGILYSEHGMAASAHHLLAAALHPHAYDLHRDTLPATPEARLDYFRTTLADILAEARTRRCRDIILSSEYLWGVFDAQMYAPWREALADHHVIVSCSLRRQDHWIQSSYLQALKYGETRHFDQWYQAMQSDRTRGCHFYDVIRHWEQAFDSAEVHVDLYEALLDQNRVFTSLLQRIHPRFPLRRLAPLPHRVNASPSPQSASLLLALNQSNLSDAHKGTLRDSLLQTMSQRQIGDPLDVIDPQHRDTLLASHAQQNRQIATRYLGGDATALYTGASPVN